MKKKHWNSQKRIYFEDAVYFITTNTKNWIQFFKEKCFCDLFIENLKICKKLKKFKLYAWFLGYDHFHLLIRPNDEFNISDVIHCLKRNVSRNINRVIFYSAGENSYPRHYRNLIHQVIGEHMNARLRVWGIDYNARLREYGINYEKIDSVKQYKFKWQRGFNDHIIRNDKDFHVHWEYLAWNPVKHKMPENWSYVFTNPEYHYLIDGIEL